MQTAIASPREAGSGSGSKTWRRSSLEIDDGELDTHSSYFRERHSEPCAPSRATFAGTTPSSSPRRFNGERRSSLTRDSLRVFSLRSSAPMKRWSKTTKSGSSNSDDDTPNSSIRLSGGQLPPAPPANSAANAPVRNAGLRTPMGVIWTKQRRADEAARPLLHATSLLVDGQILAHTSRQKSS